MHTWIVKTENIHRAVTQVDLGSLVQLNLRLLGCNITTADSQVLTVFLYIYNLVLFNADDLSTYTVLQVTDDDD